MPIASMRLMKFHALYLQDLVLAVHLGCEPPERMEAQEVRVSLSLRWPETPKAVLSDQLEDTVCYARLSQAIQALVEGREFRLIEKLGGDIYNCVRAQIPSSTSLKVRVHKVRPPIRALQGGAVYECGDFAE